MAAWRVASTSICVATPSIISSSAAASVSNAATVIAVIVRVRRHRADGARLVPQCRQKRSPASQRRPQRRQRSPSMRFRAARNQPLVCSSGSPKPLGFLRCSPRALVGQPEQRVLPTACSTNTLFEPKHWEKCHNPNSLKIRKYASHRSRPGAVRSGPITRRPQRRRRQAACPVFGARVHLCEPPAQCSFHADPGQGQRR